MPALRDARYTIPIGTLVNLPPLLQTLGVDGWTLLERCGLSRDHFQHTMRPIPLALAGHIVETAMRASGCRELPLLLGMQAKMENVGAMQLLVRSAALVGDAIDALVRFRQIWYPGFQLVLSEQQGMASLSISLQPQLASQQALRTTFISAVTRHLHAIVGPACRLSAVHLSLAAPADREPYQAAFGLMPQFGQHTDALFFDARFLRMRCASETIGDESIQSFLRGQLSLAPQTHGGNYVEQVADLIGTLLMGRQCSAEHLAAVMGIHRLTLYRRLQQHNTTFEQLLDQQRCAMAQEMLGRGTLPIAAVADALGYSSATNFTRAFRRWTGSSPRAWQNAATR